MPIDKLKPTGRHSITLIGQTTPRCEGLTHQQLPTHLTGSTYHISPLFPPGQLPHCLLETISAVLNCTNDFNISGYVKLKDYIGVNMEIRIKQTKAVYNMVLVFNSQCTHSTDVTMLIAAMMVSFAAVSPSSETKQQPCKCRKQLK